MADHLQSFIQDLIHKNDGIFKDADFKDCKGSAADIEEMLHNLESTEVHFKRKLSELSVIHPPDKEKIIYLQGLVDGMNLAIKPLQLYLQCDGGNHPAS
ncbi:hypothetical protein [Paenibacillus piri]|uniref:Uncharacterized protein n=1 Tax=Paenibacillus piri TaxID=2547395 RepID=A0A4R5KQS2_9BACL|nr:hypothetical protein [Paenibacillus piri]TDF98091.1 hypothetical protein E1757_11325 [Paenibacillus piri]